MNPALAAAMAANHGLVTRRQAVAAGIAPDRIDRLVRSGDWIAVRRGVYAERLLVESLTTPRDRQLLSDRAASLAMLRPHLRSHDSAALELDLPILMSRPALTHVTRPGVVGSRTRFGVKHHLAPYRPDDVVLLGDIAVLGAARTAIDIAREHGVPAGVVAADSALRSGAVRHDLETACEPMRSWPHVTWARDAVDLADPGSDSVGESLARLLVIELGLGRPQTQFGLTDGGRVAWCDLRIGRHVFEFDGKLKYHRPENGGVATERAEEVVWREKQRQDWVCGFKLGMSRIVWADLWGDARRRALARLAREYADTVTRFGDSVEDLTPYVVRASRRRAA